MALAIRIAVSPWLNGAKRWLFAIALGVAATAIRPWLTPNIGPDVTFILAFPAVAASAWYGGGAPGLVTAVVAASGYAALTADGVLSGTLWSGRLLIFALGTVAIAALGEHVRRGRAALRMRAELAEERAAIAAEHEAALVESSRRESVLQSILDYVPEGITIAWGPDANIAVVSQHGLALIQKTASQVAGIPAVQHPQAWEIYTPEGIPVQDGAGLPLTRACRGEVTKNCEYLIRATDGSLIPILCDAGPIRDSTGAVVGGIIAWRDITERKRVERALHDALSQLELLLAHTPLAVVSWDDQFCITRWAGEAERLFGWPAREALGKTIDELGIVHPDDIMAVGNVAARLKSGAERFVISRNRNVTRSGAVLSCVWYNSVLPKAEGGMEATLSLVLDITEQERTERELALANATKDTFLATLAHELRNPLAPLRTCAVMLDVKAATDDSLTPVARMIERQVKQMSRLLDDLLDVSRITLNRLELHRETISLIDVIDAAIEQVRPALDRAQQTLTTAFPSVSPVVRADRARLTQVFSNLLQNAAKYSITAGTVSIIVSVEESWVRVAIEDSGVGIAPDALESIFGLFVRSGEGTSSQVPGLGIGLALVRGVVELHGGSVQAFSRGPGTGSTFTIQLPVCEAAVEAPRPAQSLSSSTSSTGISILVVDDNRDAADSLADVLRMLGHTADVCYSGNAALQRFEKNVVDVVLLDIGMPDVSGYAVAQQIRSIARGQEVLLVAVTGWAQQGDQLAAKTAGFDHHMIKPIDVGSLLELLSAYARKKDQAGQTAGSLNQRG